MNVIQIEAKNLNINVPCPGSWNELDDKTALLFYQTFFETPGDEFSRTAFTMVKLITMAMMVLGIDKEFLDMWAASCIAKDQEHGEEIFLEELKQVVTAALAGLFDMEKTEDGATTYAVKYNRTKNLWPVLEFEEIAPWVLFAPADGLSNITLYEMGRAFTYYEQYVLNPENEHLANLLLATIYRPSRAETPQELESGWSGDRRQPLRRYESMIEQRVQVIEELPILMRRFMVFWFASCRQAIVDAYPKVFQYSGEKEGPDYGWGGVLLALAGGPPGLDLIADQNYGNGMVWLSMKADEAEAMEERIAEARR